MSLSAGAAGTVAGAGRWGPKDLGTGLAAWFDASVTSSVTTVSGAVSQWDDLSGNANHATQATAGNRPDSVTDGVQFTRANSDRMVVSNLNNATPRCYGVVITRSSNLVDQAIVGGTADGFGFEISVTSNKIAASDIWRTQYLLSTGSLSTSMSVALVNATTSAARVSINGTGNTNTSARTFTGTEMFLGVEKNTSSNFANHLGATLHEVVIAASQTTAMQQVIEGYLAWKWALQGDLPNDHPYKNIRP